MRSTALHHLEALLDARNLAGTLTATRPPAHVRMAATGIAALDDLLGGGWRRGEVSEIVGPRSSGRTSLLLTSLAAATERDELVALVDAFDRFDPRPAASAGLALTRLLWVRGPALTVEMARPAVIEAAVHQAIRAFDLIIRAGGFSIVALDLADVPAARLRALPFATWLRLAHANEGRQAACVLAGTAPMGRSARGTTTHLAAGRIWTGSSAQSRRFGGFKTDDLLSFRGAGQIGSARRA